MLDIIIDNKDINQLIQNIQLLLILKFISLFSAYANKMLYIKLKTKISFQLNSDILNHMLKLPLNYFSKTTDTAYLTQRINGDSNILITFYINTLKHVIINLITLLVSSVIIIRIDKWIFIYMCLLIIIYLIIYSISKKQIYSRSFVLKENENIFFAKLNEYLSDLKFIKLNCIDNLYKDRLSNSFNHLLFACLKYEKFSYVFSSLGDIINFIAQLLIYFIGGIAIINNEFTIGMLIILINYFNIFLNSMLYFFNFTKQYQETLVSYSRIKELFDIKTLKDGDITLSSINTIRIKNLNFSFENKILFENFSYDFSRGNIYCLKGANGVGKTSLIYILLGLYDYNNQSNVFYNSTEIKDLDMSFIRKHLIAVCEQNFFLFKDTILTNLTFNNSYSPEQLDALSCTLNATNIINHNFYSYIINEKNNNLSGGERQKISLIRTFLKNADFIVLDEPTSALDISSKKELIKYLLDIRKSKIIIIITHDQELMEIADFCIEM